MCRYVRVLHGGVTTLLTDSDYARAEQMLAPYRARKVPGASLHPQWLPGGNRFWYQVGTRHMMVDPAAGVRRAAFDHDRLAAELSVASGHAVNGGDLPISGVEFDGDAMRFSAFQKTWVWSDDAGLRESDHVTPLPGEVPSPDEQWVAFSRDGTRLAQTSPDGRVRLYDLTVAAKEPKVVQRLSPRAGGRVRFSDDGETLLVDGIYLMDGHTLQLMGPRLHPDEWNDPSKDLGTNATFFTPDGQYVVAERGDSSQLVRWAVGTETLRARACSIAARNLTRDEAEQFQLGSKALARCPFPLAGG